MRKKTGKQIVSLILAVWILLTASASAFDCPIVAEEAAETAVAAAAAASDGENDYAAYLSALPACDMSAAPAIDVPIAENPAMERGGCHPFGRCAGERTVYHPGGISGDRAGG